MKSGQYVDATALSPDAVKVVSTPRKVFSRSGPPALGKKRPVQRTCARGGRQDDSTQKALKGRRTSSGAPPVQKPRLSQLDSSTANQAPVGGNIFAGVHVSGSVGSSFAGTPVAGEHQPLEDTPSSCTTQTTASSQQSEEMANLFNRFGIHNTCSPASRSQQLQHLHAVHIQQMQMQQQQQQGGGGPMQQQQMQQQQLQGSGSFAGFFPSMPTSDFVTPTPDANGNNGPTYSQCSPTLRYNRYATQDSFSVAALTRFQMDFVELEEIGKGSFGRVVLARENCSQELCAVKICGAMQGRMDYEKKVQERRVLSSVRHLPYCITMYNAWVDGSHPTLHIQMQYCPGGNVENQAVQRRGRGIPWRESEVLVFLGQMTMALHAMHQLAIAHVDFKLENVLIDASGNFVLSDFGCAIYLDPQTGKPQAPMAMASQREDSITLWHRASQSADWSQDEGDSRYVALDMMNEKRHYRPGDIFSLGISVYELLSGTELPKNGADFQHLRKRHSFDGLLERGYSPALVSLVQLMMDPEPTLRPSAEAILQSPLFSLAAPGVVTAVEQWKAQSAAGVAVSPVSVAGASQFGFPINSQTQQREVTLWASPEEAAAAEREPSFGDNEEEDDVIIGTPMCAPRKSPTRGAAAGTALLQFTQQQEAIRLAMTCLDIQRYLMMETIAPRQHIHHQQRRSLSMKGSGSPTMFHGSASFNSMILSQTGTSASQQRGVSNNNNNGTCPRGNVVAHSFPSVAPNPCSFGIQLATGKASQGSTNAGGSASTVRPQSATVGNPFTNASGSGFGSHTRDGVVSVALFDSTSNSQSGFLNTAKGLGGYGGSRTTSPLMGPSGSSSFTTPLRL